MRNIDHPRENHMLVVLIVRKISLPVSEDIPAQVLAILLWKFQNFMSGNRLHRPHAY